MTPNFEDFIDFYLNWGPLGDSLKDTLIFTAILITTIVFEKRFSDSKLRNQLLVAIVAKIMNSLCSLLLSLNILFGLSRF